MFFFGSYPDVLPHTIVCDASAQEKCFRQKKWPLCSPSASVNSVKSIILIYLFPDFWRFRGKLNAPSLPDTDANLEYAQQTCRQTAIAARRRLMRQLQTHKSNLRQYLAFFKQAGKLVETHANFAVRLSSASLVNLAARMKS